jgi:hypothetical protein
MSESKFTPAQAEERFPVASPEDIIASKRPADREKDLTDLRRLKPLRVEYELREKRKDP